MRYSIQKIAEKIKTSRKNKGLSQRDLSIKIGMPQSHISKIENGIVDLQLSSLIEITRTLGLELVLIPKNLLPAIEAMQNIRTQKSVPAYRLPTTEENDDET